jgi:glucuronoarabinoxylan endo-1,4-beta-xylanase
MRLIKYNRSALVCGALILFHGFSLQAAAQTAAIDAGTVYQTMDGFGGENGGPWSFAVGNTLTTAQANLLFSTTSGIGISIYRTDSADSTSTSTISFPDMTAMQQAQALGVPVELSEQSPPSYMKYSGYYYDGTIGSSSSCLSAGYSTYAAYIVAQLTYLKNNGVTVTWLDVQNEPGGITTGAEVNGFGTCGWGASQLDAFVDVLGPALASAGFGSVKLMLASMFSYSNSQNYFDTCVSDSTCNGSISVLSGHGYGYPDTPVLYADPGKHFWMSETSPNEETVFNPNMDSALIMAENMQSFLQIGQVSAYEWWQLGYQNGGGTGNCVNCGLVDQNFNPTKRYFAFGNYSEFVRPGQVEIAATQSPQSGVTVTAFENQATGAFEIVAINSNGSSVSQAFNLTGVSTNSVVPYITDPNNNLASQPSVAVTSGSFTATLTPSSVTTFVSSGGRPPAPSNLSGTIVQ